MERVCAFLREAKNYYLATVNDGKPELRPFGTANIYNGRLYIQTGKRKAVSKQILNNPFVAVCAVIGGDWLRISCELVEDDDREARVSMLSANPELMPLYDPDDGNMQVFYMKNATAVFSSFTKPHEVVTF